MYPHLIHYLLTHLQQSELTEKRQYTFQCSDIPRSIYPSIYLPVHPSIASIDSSTFQPHLPTTTDWYWQSTDISPEDTTRAFAHHLPPRFNWRGEQVKTIPLKPCLSSSVFPCLLPWYTPRAEIREKAARGTVSVKMLESDNKKLEK